MLCIHYSAFWPCKRFFRFTSSGPSELLVSHTQCYFRKLMMKLEGALSPWWLDYRGLHGISWAPCGPHRLISTHRFSDVCWIKAIHCCLKWAGLVTMTTASNSSIAVRFLTTLMRKQMKAVTFLKDPGDTWHWSSESSNDPMYFHVVWACFAITSLNSTCYTVLISRYIHRLLWYTWVWAPYWYSLFG